MGGTKRKIPMQKIEKKDSRAVAFSKRRKGLYAKASELCLLSGSSIAILATPVSSKSNASFYSFGHSSVDSVVSAFLENQPLREDSGLGFWWEDKSLLESEDPNELRDALESMEMMMNKVNDLKKKKKKKDVAVIDGTHQNQTLNYDSSLCILEDLPADTKGFVKTTEGEEEWMLTISDKNKNDGNLHLSGLHDDQILAISDKDNNNALPGDLSGCIPELDQIFDVETNSKNLSMNDVSMMTTNQYPCLGYGSAEDEGKLVMYRDQFLSLSDNNNETGVTSANLDGFNQEFDVDEIFDFDTKLNESLLMKMDDASMMNTESLIGMKTI